MSLARRDLPRVDHRARCGRRERRGLALRHGRHRPPARDRGPGRLCSDVTPDGTRARNSWSPVSWSSSFRRLTAARSLRGQPLRTEWGDSFTPPLGARSIGANPQRQYRRACTRTSRSASRWSIVTGSSPGSAPTSTWLPSESASALLVWRVLHHGLAAEVGRGEAGRSVPRCDPVPAGDRHPGRQPDRHLRRLPPADRRIAGARHSGCRACTATPPGSGRPWRRRWWRQGWRRFSWCAT